jgi:hypothetical protein
MKPIRYIVIGLIAFSCNRQYEPQELRKLSQEEIIERAQNGIKPNPHVIVKNEDGEIISPDSIAKIPDIESWTTDVYVNAEGLDVELVLRPATNEDIETRDKVAHIESVGPEVKHVDVDCADQRNILQRVLESDQAIRSEESAHDPGVDHRNLETVISLIEKCGMPTLEEVDNSHMLAIWLVFQHASSTYRKKYFPLLEDAAERGDLDHTQIAMMKDRMLMEEGKPQVYGTQVIKDTTSGAWILYKLEEPELVNKRRAEIGFGPLEEYLRRWDIEFGVEQRGEMNDD